MRRTIVALAALVLLAACGAPKHSAADAQANLAAAKQMIDILSLLEEKTRGNLTAEERQLLDQLLYELRLRFVEASKQGPAPEPSRIIIP